jgi:hypothetical protein
MNQKCFFQWPSDLGLFFQSCNLVYKPQGMVRKAVENSWKLKAIDSINSSDDISRNDRKNLVDSLIDDTEIKTILLQAHF